MLHAVQVRAPAAAGTVHAAQLATPVKVPRVPVVLAAEHEMQISLLAALVVAYPVLHNVQTVAEVQVLHPVFTQAVHAAEPPPP